MTIDKQKKLTRKEVKETFINLINEFQKKTTKKLLNKINAKTKRIAPNKNEDSMREAINYLRVCIKYTLYDLEATRRELRIAIRNLQERDKK